MNGSTQSIETLPCSFDDGLGQRARIGLVILQTDQTIEHELSQLLRQDGVALYHARIPNATTVTPATLRQMEQDLPHTVQLLPTSFDFNAIGYCCTSGATSIGEEKVGAIIKEHHPHASTSNPMSACKAALTALGVKRLALVTPYAPDVTKEMQENLASAGFEIMTVATFNQSDDFQVARITTQNILDSVVKVGMHDDCDGVFVSCTSLRALPIIEEAEARIGKPVISSNQALAWHLMRLVGMSDAPDASGTLFNASLTS